MSYYKIINCSQRIAYDFDRETLDLARQNS